MDYSVRGDLATAKCLKVWKSSELVGRGLWECKYPEWLVHALPIPVETKVTIEKRKLCYVRFTVFPLCRVHVNTVRSLPY